MDRMIRMEEEPKAYDLCGEIIGAAMKVHSARSDLDFGCYDKFLTE